MESNEQTTKQRGSGQTKRRILGFLGLGILLLGIFFLSREIFFHEENHFEQWNGSVLPDVELTTLEQNEISLYQLLKQSGKSKAIIALWATWCEPCVKELPLIEKALPRLHAQDTEVILVNYDGAPADKTIPEVKAWLISRDVALKTVFDFQDKILQTLEVAGLPFAIGVGADKKVQWMEIGELDWSSEKLKVD